MTQQELYQHIADRTGEDIETLESYGFELHSPTFEPDRKELKRQRRLRLWRQARREKRLADLASKLSKS